MAYTCRHEADVCKIVLVATPDISSLVRANEDIQSSLYREPVNIDTVCQQHTQLIRVLERAGVEVKDVSSVFTEPQPNLENIIFTRDPILVTPKGVVLGRFREPVRRGETELFRTFLAKYDIPLLGEIEAPGFVEGGDFIPAGDVSFIATGNRTNDAGIQQMLQKDLFGTKFVATINYPEDGQMKAIHADCYLGLVGKKHAIVWEYALKCATVTEYVKHTETQTYVVSQKTVPLRSYLEQQGFSVIPVDDVSQARYGCNLLDLGNNRMLTQDAYVTEELTKLGYSPLYVQFEEIHKMYGGIRCATQVLQRVTYPE